ncbi:purple acid phosphatase family protein [Schlesneria paludicola]|uniref:purple acid phosphatase family protein n=1 Tax=Schlesneria paludicola TaxID=360056 RepID=UPI000299FC22|nr:metallophosphoesterase family protein [Schlesneria paludicola]
MSSLHRREFLGSSLGGFAAAFAFGPSLFAQDTVTAAAIADAASLSFAPDTLFLSWQQDPTSSMTVQWIGSETPADVSVKFATVDNPLWQLAKTITKPFSTTDLKVFRTQLTGLKDGTEYQFQIGNAAKIYRFRTMPQKATNTIQFVSGGDAGVDEHAVKTNILAAKQEPYFALIGGDLAYDNGKSPETFIKFLQNYHGHMIDAKGRLIPMLSCIGNHEVNGSYKMKRDKSPNYLSVFDNLFPEKTFGVLDIGDYLSLVLLDTDHLEPIAGEQTSWLEKTLADRQDRPHLMVANHVPAYPSYRAMEGANGGNGTGHEQRVHWCPLFERYNVDVVLEHHDHTFKRSHPLTNGLKDKNGVLYLGDGSWGKLRAAKTPEERPYLAATSSAYHVTVHRLEGEQRFHMALEESGKVADVCMTTNKRPARRG